VIVDFLLTLPGYEEQIIERAIQRDLGGWSVWTCSAEDLIIQKAVAGRGKDWPDIEALLIERDGKLD
jgi:predicted nucleotidyltransferase